MPIDLPGIVLPKWNELFPSAAANYAVLSPLWGAQVGCKHWDEVLRHGPLQATHTYYTVHANPDVDYAPVRQCEHSLGSVLRSALEGIETWGSVGPKVVFVLARCLAIVMAKRLDRDNRLWDVVFDWIVACIDQPRKGAVRTVAMEFLSQLHIELNWKLRHVFPGLIAKLGDVSDVEKFPIGFQYCLDVAHQEIFPAVKASFLCEAQPSLEASCLLLPPVLEVVLEYLDFESVASLRATCQLVRGAVDGLAWGVRQGIGENRKADLWMRATPNVRDFTIYNKLKDIYVNVYDHEVSLALAGHQIYFSVMRSFNGSKRLATVNISQPRPKFHVWNFSPPLHSAFYKMANEHIVRSEDRFSRRTPWLSYLSGLPNLDCGLQLRRIAGTVEEPEGRLELLLTGSVVNSYAGSRVVLGSFKTKASHSKKTVFIMFCRWLGDYQLEVLDVGSRSVSPLATLNAHPIYFADLAWQCAGDAFVIAQIAHDTSNILKAFARVNDEWVAVGEKRVSCNHLRLYTLRVGDGVAAWKEVVASPYTGPVGETVVKVLDVRPAALARICRDGGNVFEVSKVIRVPGHYQVGPFERGFFAFKFCSEKKTIRLRVVDMEEVSATGGWKTLNNGSVALDVQKEDDDANEDNSASTAKRRRRDTD